MAGYVHIAINHVSGTAGNVTLVRLLDRKIIDPEVIHRIGEELYQLVQEEKFNNLIINFSSVDLMGTSLLNKLLALDKKLKANTGKMQLCNLRPEINEVFVTTQLHTLFDIKATEKDALAKS